MFDNSEATGYFPKNHVDLLSHPVTTTDSERNALLKRQSNDFVAPLSPSPLSLEKQLSIDEKDPFGDDQELLEEMLLVGEDAPLGEDVDSDDVVLQEDATECLQEETRNDTLLIDGSKEEDQELPLQGEVDREEDDGREEGSPQSHDSPSSIDQADDVPLAQSEDEIGEASETEASNLETHEVVGAMEQIDHKDLTLHYAPNGDAYYYDSASGKTEWKKDYDERHGLVSVYPSPQPLVLDPSDSNESVDVDVEKDEQELSPTDLSQSSASPTGRQDEYEVGLHDTFGDLQLNSSSGLDPRWV